ncbi:DUF1428 family protein [bacterium]|nr:DUF1428 family protein [bacterium]
MTYINSFVAAVPTTRKQEYIETTTKMDRWFKQKGALRVVECWGVDVPAGKLTSFPLAVKKTADETVVTGWIEWPSRAASDKAMGEMMSDPEMAALTMPFDGKRMIFGGFEVIVDV